MRTWRLVLIPAIVATVFLFLGVLLTLAAAPPALPAGQDSPDAYLSIEANYAQDWVGGYTDFSVPVVVTVTAPGGGVKDLAVVISDPAGFFEVDCPDWLAGSCPDIQPGDGVYASAAGVQAEIVPIGALGGLIDEINNLVTVTLPGEPFNGFLDIGLAVVPVGPTITATADLSQGTYVFDLNGVWDIQRGDTILVSYDEPDGDRVANTLPWPWLRANLAHDWVGANYELGHTVWITVTDSLGDVKAFGHSNSVSNGGWAGPGFTISTWLPAQPDIVPGDWVFMAADDGYTSNLWLGELTGSLSSANDLVSGQVLAPWINQTVTVECHPWGAWAAGLNDAPIKQSSAAPDGSQPYTCQWDPQTEYDLLPGQDVAVMYIEADMDRVIDVYREPAPDNLTMDVNYGHDWVQGPYEPGHLVTVTVTESDAATVKGFARLYSMALPEWEGATGFSTLLAGWDGNHPDLQPGDWVFGQADDGGFGSVRVGEITVQVDADADLVYGSLQAGWLSGAVPLRCEIWEPEGAPAIELWVDPQGGGYGCEFGNFGWDILPGQMIAVMYPDPAGHQVINMARWPRLGAETGPLSDGDRHLWGEGAASGATVAITVTTSLGELVANASLPADADGNFETGLALPAGALDPWNRVQVDFGNSLTETLTVYPIVAQADPASDVVTIAAAGQPTYTISLEYCFQGQCGWSDLGEIGPSGQVVSDLMAAGEFDIRPGASFYAHLYTRHNNEVIYSWALEEPRLYLPVVVKP